MKTINQSNNHKKIVSLHLEANQYKQTIKLADSNTFANVQSLTIFNFQDEKQIYDMRIYFPILIYLSLRYYEEIDFHGIPKIFSRIPSSIERLDIYCDSIICSHYRSDYIFAKIVQFNTTVKSFMLHMDYPPRSLVNNCVRRYPKCVLRTITDFIRIMSNIQYFRVILNEGSVVHFLDEVEWMCVMDMCQQLEKISLKTKKSMSYDIPSVEKIGKELRQKRESMKLEVQVKQTF